MKINRLKHASWHLIAIYSCMLSFFFPVLQMKAQGVENKQVTISPRTLTIKQILQQIETQSGISFVYTRLFADVNRTITLQNNRNDLNALFREMSEKTGLEFIPSGKQVVIRERTTEKSQPSLVLSGVVVSKDLGSALPGVTVRSPQAAVITDINGRFSIAVKINENITFSFLGMQSVSYLYTGDKKTVTIAMEASSGSLDEVVVTGYQTQKKADLTGAVAVVNTEDIKDIPLGNPLKALQGRVPGMSISGDGSPNGAMTVRIRGIGTMNNNDPLYVIDGVPTKRGLQELNQNDIASIQVLKDASSATIYGSRAANGVIIITTKRARRKFSRIDVDASSSIQYYANRPKPLDTDGRGRAYWMAAVNDKTDPNLNSTYKYDWNKDYSNPVLNHIILPEFIDDAKTMKPANTDWFREVSQVSSIQSLNISMSSGNERGNSIFSLGYYDNKGILKESRAQKITARLNTDYGLLNNRLKIGENFSINYIKTALTTEDLFGAMIQQPIVPVHTIDGGWGGPASGMSNTPNPVLEIENSRNNKNHFFRILGNVYADWLIIPNLSFKTNVGVDFSGSYQRTLRPSYKQGFLIDPSNKVETSQLYDGNIVFQNTLNYKLNSGKHHFDFLLGQEMIKYIYQEFGASRQGYAVETMDYAYLDAGSSNPANSGTGYGYSLLSYFGKVNYILADKYLASVTLRRDGSSRFGKDNRYGIFPAYSLGWRMSEEKFMKSLSFISDFKLRYGWGKTGNQEIANNAAYSLYASQYTSTAYDVNGTAYDIGGNGTGQLPSGFRLIQQGNDALKWESTIQSNFGIDFGLFENRLSGAVDYFIKKSSDILIKPPYLAVIGEGGDKWINGASMENKGFELMLGYKGSLARDVSFSVSGNIASYRNKVTYLPSDVLPAYPGNGTDKTILGRPKDVAFGYIADGLFQSKAEVDAHAEQPGKAIGRIRYKDLNGDGVVNYLDQDYIANYNPDFTYGLNVAIAYRNFDLGFFFQGVQGVDVYNGTKNYSDFASAAYAGANWGSRTLDAWTPANNKSTIPALTLVDRNNEARTSTYYIENGSYLKLRNIQLGYNLKGLLKNVKAQNAIVYIQGSNLFTIKSRQYTGTDPENYTTAFPIPVTLTIGGNFSF